MPPPNMFEQVSLVQPVGWTRGGIQILHNTLVLETHVKRVSFKYTHTHAHAHARTPHHHHEAEWCYNFEISSTCML